MKRPQSPREDYREIERQHEALARKLDQAELDLGRCQAERARLEDTVGRMNTLAALGWQEILLFGLVLLLFFGARKLPELARSLGSSMNEFKKGMRDEPPAPKGGNEPELPAPKGGDKPRKNGTDSRS